MSEVPRLYIHKPRKGQVKPKYEEGRPLSQPPVYPPRPPPPPPLPPTRTTTASAPKESFVRRYKFVWPVLLMVNLAVGVSVFLRTKKMDYNDEAEEVGHEVPVPVADMSTTVSEQKLPSQPAILLSAPRRSVPEEEQRNLFKWMLEEKRKLETNDPMEKKQIDEEKTILKQYIQANSIPTI